MFFCYSCCLFICLFIYFKCLLIAFYLLYISSLHPLLRINYDGRLAVVSRRAPKEVVGFTIPPGDYETLAGFVLTKLGHVPRAGERIIEGNWLLEVTRASDRAILEVRISQREP